MEKEDGIYGRKNADEGCVIKCVIAFIVVGVKMVRRWRNYDYEYEYLLNGIWWNGVVLWLLVETGWRGTAGLTYYDGSLCVRRIYKLYTS